MLTKPSISNSPEEGPQQGRGMLVGSPVSSKSLPPPRALSPKINLPPPTLLFNWAMHWDHLGPVH